MDTSKTEGEKLHKFVTTFNPKSIDHSAMKIINLIVDFPVQKTRQMKLMQFKVRDAFFDEDEDFEQGRKRRFKELQLKIRKRIKELFKGNPHAKIESSIPVLPTMPKNIQSAVGKNRGLFKDNNKEKAKNFTKERVNE